MGLPVRSFPRVFLGVSLIVAFTPSIDRRGPNTHAACTILADLVCLRNVLASPQIGRAADAGSADSRVARFIRRI
jgi:hypothetical protein